MARGSRRNAFILPDSTDKAVRPHQCDGAKQAAPVTALVQAPAARITRLPERVRVLLDGFRFGNVLGVLPVSWCPCRDRSPAAGPATVDPPRDQNPLLFMNHFPEGPSWCLQARRASPQRR